MLHGAVPGADSRRSRCRAAIITGACPRKYSLVAPRVHELVGLLVEQLVQGLLDGLGHQLPDVALYRLVVE